MKIEPQINTDERRFFNPRMPRRECVCTPSRGVTLGVFIRVHQQFIIPYTLKNHREHRGHREKITPLCALCVLCGFKLFHGLSETFIILWLKQ
ncbi:MAG: hypothetical protein L6263_11515 [Desulfobacteraceae bacterium]|nr:hypothetical protein [Desulfobacteraceae bacterium]